MVDSHYLGYELSWEDSVLDVVDNFIHRVFQRTVNILFLKYTDFVPKIGIVQGPTVIIELT